MKVQLIHPANDNKHSLIQNGYKSFPPPAGLEILASYILSKKTNVDFEIFDGNTTSTYEIISNIYADFIGISDWFSNHLNAIDIAKKIKQRNPNCKIAIGGPNATNLGDRILKKYSFVDYVICGDGEESLFGLLDRQPFNIIPNLWYRQPNSEITFTFKKVFNINKSEPYNLDHLYSFNFYKYNSNSLNYNETMNLAPMPISSIRGCIKAKKYGACSFCSIIDDSKLTVKSAANFWNQIEFLYKKYGIRKFFESGDSFVIGNYPEKLLISKPIDLNIHLRIYANIETLSEQKIEILAKIGVKEIFIGIENIDPSILKQSNKVIDTKQVVKTLEIIEKFNIHPFLSFILGLPGESKESMKKNHDFARQLSYQFTKMNHISFNVGFPLIGSDWFKTLMNNSFIEKYYFNFTNKSLFDEDDIDYELLFLLSLKEYSTVSFAELYKQYKKPLHPRLINQVAGFGSIADNIFHSERYNSVLNEFWGKTDIKENTNKFETLELSSLESHAH